MKIIPCSDNKEMGRLATNSVLAALEIKPGMLLCPASGNSAVGIYENLARSYLATSSLFSQLRIIMLDEWYGIPSDDAHSGKAFLEKYIIHPLSISEDRFFYFDSTVSVPEKECERVQAVLRHQGPIDLCILGLGKNGHLGFNEPAAALTPHCHLSKLSETSQTHAMISELANPPEFGLTLGMADILQSKKIVLLLTGDDKRPVIEKMMTKNVSTQLPASLLWLHDNVECYLDRSSVVE